jgi:hypothetical protein
VGVGGASAGVGGASAGVGGAPGGGFPPVVVSPELLPPFFVAYNNREGLVIVTELVKTKIKSAVATIVIVLHCIFVYRLIWFFTELVY